ncbi:MAG: FliA/WhiG family RNA polymerase sigma factor [Planctomycetaceae bacterium]|nr:FliA/WhiG family RNA polymerase sigma factor [Planctomycetaceae bacterium]
MSRIQTKKISQHLSGAGTPHFNVSAASLEDGVNVPAAAEEDDIDQLWILYKKNPTDQLRNRLTERYMPIVRSKAARLWDRLPDGVELDDLMSAGHLGLMDAIAAFDLTRGIKFEAFCVTRIQGAMLDELRKMDCVPRMIRSKATKLNEAYKALELASGRKPSDEEVADYLQITVEELHQFFAETRSASITSLDKVRSDFGSGDSKDIREMDVIADKRSEDPTERMAKIDLIRSFTKGLTKTERMVVILYYYEEMTMREIGLALGLSESRVSQMHTGILERIKKMYK